MSQSQYIQAGVQVEAGLELREMLRPVIRKALVSLRSMRPQPQAAEQDRAERPISKVKVHQG